MAAKSKRYMKEKGARFERQLAEFLTEKLGVDVMRSLYTGDPMTRKGKGSADLIGTPRLSVEAKCVERLNFHEAHRQAKRNAGADEVPIVVNKRSGVKVEETMVVIELHHFVEMYREWAYAQGYLK
jgi:hypothetical protein